MNLTVHRGTREIGGTCVVVTAAGGERLVLDLGRPLAGDPTLPPVPGLYADAESPSVLGVVVTHAHQDHAGLLGHVHTRVPVYASEGTIALLKVSAVFLPDGQPLPHLVPLPRHGGIDIGPFRVTPSVVDHSAPDAVALLIEADGKRLFYTGDLRAHGRKGALFDRLLAHPPPHLDAVLMEGTMVGQAARGQASERAVEEAMVERFRGQTNLSVVFCSSQNLDRLVSVCRAALRSGKAVIIDLYTAFVLDQLRVLSDRLPQVGWKGLRVVFFRRHIELLLAAGHGEFVDRCRARRIFATVIDRDRAGLIFLARTSLFEPVLGKLDSLDGVRFLWSMWKGYLTDDCAVARYAARHGIPVEHIHCGGHATVGDLRRLAAALAPRLLIPVHTEHPDRFTDVLPHVHLARDGETIPL